MRKKPAGFTDGVTQGFLDRYIPISGFLGVVESSASADFGLWLGHSNIVGEANYAALPNDSGYGISNSTGFAGCTINEQIAQSIIDPMPWVSTGTVTLRAYAPAGSANMGAEQGCGRDLYNYGICTAPVITKIAVAGSVLNTHWLPSSTFPITVGNLYTQAVTYQKAREVEFGRKTGYIVIGLGENDVSVQANADAFGANLVTLCNALRVSFSNPTLPIFIVRTNSGTTGTYLSTVTAAQNAYVAGDPYSRIVIVDDIKLAADNVHYPAIGYISYGSRIALALKTYFRPTLSLNLSSGAVPWLQQADPGFGVNVSGTAIPRSGIDPQDGDWEILVASTYTEGVAPTLSVAAGFTAIGTMADSLFSGLHRTLSFWERPVTTAILNANGGRMPNPSLTFGTDRFNVARIFGFRGPNKWTVSPVDTITTGVNNANNTSLSIGSGTTSVDNCLMAIFATTVNTSGAVNSLTNASFSNITSRWDSRYATTTVLGIAMYTATKASAGSFGATAVTTSGAGVNAGAVIAIKP